MHSHDARHNRPLPVAADGRSAGHVARDCARLAGAILRHAFGVEQHISRKGRGNIVTECDLQVEAAVAGLLREAFPEHGLLAEETADKTEARGFVWVMDPIDGTRNFASGIPFFCFNLALTFDAEPVLALTLDPVRDELFYAERGRGLTVNSVAASCSDKPSVQESVLALDLGYDDAGGKQQLAFAHWLYPRLQSLRTPGCAALGLAYAATGRYDCFSHPFLYPWDSAAGLLLVREGGGEVTTRGGAATTIFDRDAVAGGKSVQADFLRLWREFRRQDTD
ncbi:MAG: inositol monophosphatase family protein [Dehalococcoidia bacterium]